MHINVDVYQWRTERVQNVSVAYRTCAKRMRISVNAYQCNYYNLNPNP